MKRSILFYLLIFVFTGLTAFSGELPKNNKTKTMIVSGKIVDPSTNESLVGVKITCSHCKKTMYSDLDGRFFMYLEINTDEKLSINFSQVGYTSKDLNLQDIQANSSNLFVDLISE